VNIKNGKSIIAGIVAAILALVIALNSFTIITTGSEASVESFGKVHLDKVLTGFNLVAPWWGIDEYNGLLETKTLEDKGIPSQDKFKTQMDISYTGHFLYGYADKIRSTTGTDTQFLNTHVEKKVRSCTIGAGTRVISSQAFFEEKTQAFMTQFVLECVNDYMQDSVVGGGFELTQVQFTEINLDPVVRKFMVTTKERQEEEEQQESKLRIADLKSQEITKTSASNRLASVDNKISSQNVSDAKMYDMKQEALGNIDLAKSVTPELVRYMEAQRWDGKRSQVVAGSGTELLIDTRKQ
jgi:regulator of protease activity HflC (stomatin/prohibitin superfamily)